MLCYLMYCLAWCMPDNNYWLTDWLIDWFCCSVVTLWLKVPGRVSVRPTWFSRVISPSVALPIPLHWKRSLTSCHIIFCDDIQRWLFYYRNFNFFLLKKLNVWYLFVTCVFLVCFIACNHKNRGVNFFWDTV